MKKLLSLILVLIMVCSVSSTSFAVDSYTEYFSEEREFTVGNNTYGFSTVFFSNEEDNNYLYSRNVDTKVETLIVAYPVLEVFLWDEILYCSTPSNKLIKMSITGDEIEELITVDNTITQIYANGELVFFSTPNSIFRYHIDSNTNDKIIDDENIGFFYPYSNYVVEWSRNDEKNAYRYDVSDDSIVPLDDYTFMKRIGYAQHMSRSTYNINGIPLPYTSGYLGVNRYYNTLPNNTSCAAHHSAGPCDDINGFHENDLDDNCQICRCYPDPAGVDLYAYQCAGFALEVYDNIFGDFPSKTNVNREINGEADARNFFEDIHIGTLARGRRGSYDHSFIVLNITNTGVTIYESNINGPCMNTTSTLTFAKFDEKYSKIKYTYEGIHSFSGYSYDRNYHWKACITSNCGYTKDRELHDFMQVISGVKRCRTCMYQDNISINSYDNIVSN